MQNMFVTELDVYRSMWLYVLALCSFFLQNKGLAKQITGSYRYTKNANQKQVQPVRVTCLKPSIAHLIAHMTTKPLSQHQKQKQWDQSRKKVT